MTAAPDITLAELRDRLADRGIEISHQSINDTLHALGYRYKKTAHAAEQERADVAAKRDHWRNWQYWLRPDRLAFVDETGAKTNMARLRGRGLEGTRLKASILWGHWKTTTFVAGLRSTGLTAPLVLDGAMNGSAFKAYVEQILAPSLSPGDIVVMDNLSSHKVDGVRQGDQGKEGIPALSAALLSRSQSYRDGLLKAEGPAPKNRRQNTRGTRGRYRQCHRSVLAPRMPELHQTRRV